MTMDLWLDHCLQDGDSAIASSLVVKEGDVIVQKGHRSLAEPGFLAGWALKGNRE